MTQVLEIIVRNTVSRPRWTFSGNAYNIGDQRKLEKQRYLPWTILCWTNAAKVNLTCWTTCAASSSARSNGETLASYWKKHNTDYATVDMRFGVKATKEVAFQFMINNLLNKEYSYRPMAVGAPRTFVVRWTFILKKESISNFKNRMSSVTFSRKRITFVRTLNDKAYGISSSRPASRHDCMD